MKYAPLPAMLAVAVWGQSFADATTDLDPVVVTATRTPEPEENTLASVSVVDREEIERRQLRSVPDALRGLPGVTFSNAGGAGKDTLVSLRGANPDHTLVLIDGIKVGSATRGIVPFQDLPIQQIERIEVVRGPRSSLYGSEAIGGVIQIFTKRGGGPLTPRFSASAGSFETATLSGGVSGGGEDGWFNVSGSFEQTDGFNACDAAPPRRGCGVDQPDKDGYSNVGVSARAGYSFADIAEVDAHFLRSDAENEQDGSIFFGTDSRTAVQVLGGSVKVTPTDRWRISLSGGRSWDKLRSFYTQGDIVDLPVGEFNTTRDTATLQSDLAVAADQLLTLGVDYQNDQVSGSTDYAVDSRDKLGLFGEYQAGFGPVRLNLSGRQEDDEQFGSHATGSLALGYFFENGIQTRVSYGTAFQAPTFNDLYFPNYGTPDLDPVQSRSVELGVGGGFQNGSWDLSLYQTHIDDLIQPTDEFRAANVAEARIRGLEASAAARVLDFDISGALTLLDPRNRSDGPNKDNLLSRRPEQTFQMDVDRDFGRWSAGGSLFVSGRRFDDSANTIRLDGFALVGLRAEYRLSDTFRIQGRLENLLDEDYETAAFFNQPGRAFYVTVRYEP
ncbi:MAG: TonB-dependent receptor [Thiohalocapsa sp.]|nr:TonB-dependent receptor [Thiohalocapsa sp.]